MQNDFTDTAWAGGPAMLGFGDLNGQLPATAINPTSSRITTYFRRTFNVANPRQFGDLTLNLLRDDGAVVWLNGVEVHRSNMPGAPAVITPATQALRRSAALRTRTHSSPPHSMPASCAPAPTSWPSKSTSSAPAAPTSASTCRSAGD